MNPKKAFELAVWVSRRDILRGGIAAFSAASFLGKAQAEENWPTRPIRILSAGTPGSTSDLLVRAIEARLREKLGQNILLDNRPGAGGMVAAGVAANAAPDGYTFFVSNVATNSIGVTLYKKPSFDPRKDLPAVARLATLSNALTVRADRGIQSLADLVTYLKANPKHALYGSAGSGTTSHLGGILFAQRTGVELTHVPYKGTAANLTALLAGEITFTLDNLTQSVPHAKASTLKILAVTSGKRVSTHPEVPTLQEAGLANFDISSWFGMSAATGTPVAIVQRFAAEIIAALNDPAIITRLRELGAEAAPLGPAEYSAFIESETRKWAPLIRASGATVD
jgi:tripartite-type tricarboxylate transporter receptor subunit TctC